MSKRIRFLKDWKWAEDPATVREFERDLVYDVRATDEEVIDPQCQISTAGAELALSLNVCQAEYEFEKEFEQKTEAKKAKEAAEQSSKSVNDPTVDESSASDQDPASSEKTSSDDPAQTSES